MKYKVEFKRSAANGFKKLPKLEKKRIGEKIDSLSEDLPDTKSTKMKGENPFHRIRSGDYRIIYEIDEDAKMIVILKIGHRKDVYKRLYMTKP
ncbi:MAG: hypothetical protein A2V65_01715 [Deltaproteobacteria bacterium RBG_13_49_15]|nr:MAG: hypothetical protein A2V65_01715 [Deltaproteobacteria bacterium RBG_13_49_15]